MANRDLPEYTYSTCKLTNPGSSLRLLSIETATPGNIVCTLRDASTLTSEPYHCLSYAWGDPFGRDIKTPPGQMVLSKSTLPIGRNLHDALLHLYALPTQRPKLSAVWVDAVCIDQGNQTEKAEQIKIMHSIYAGAESVIIWLGPDVSEGGADMVKVRAVATAMRAEFGESAVAGSASWDVLTKLRDGELVEQKDLPRVHAIDDDSWRAVAELSTREYWQRLWVWQEVIAARVVCGGHILAWEDVRLATHARTIFAGTSEGDKKDKIFAHAGLCGRAELAEWDYSKPFEELYLHWWGSIMQRTKEVNFLAFVEDAGVRKVRPTMKNDGRNVELPTWVPDLRCCLDPPSMWDYFQGVENFNAVPRLVALIGNIAKGDTEERNNPYGSLVAAYDAVWTSMALLASTDEPSIPTPAPHKKRAIMWLCHAMSQGKIFGVDNVHIREQDQLLREHADIGGEELRSVYTEAALVSGDWGLRHMRVFVTADGWIGKGPASMRSGDEVWIVPGAEVAFILRRKEGVFSYVGHAYVHGMIGGEARTKFRNVDMELIILE
ncbi:heterokaryon incompatibility protein-domain-containing protein [Podospora aff. communis PSN243]|uniref:Heterokaryon incompatibility protein-domain-containing protein n=1 Tax=Podospora aff. communis PSN243 TaxID=3040156 RepID=A0AAV9G1Y4_9PEZI|nr:heterokaryon incompatibility protein-domain-containing protein [Podospora aff. communis PSN243]